MNPNHTYIAPSSNGGRCVAVAVSRDKSALIRRIILAMLIACAALFSTRAYGATNTVKGEMTLGLRGGYASYNQSGFNSIFFEYTFAPHFRIAPEIGYVYSHKDETAFTFDIDMQFPFRIVSGLQVFPLAGLTLNSWNLPGDRRVTRLGGDLGAGFDFYITQNFKINLQAKYSFLPKVSGLFAGLGLGYVF